jgi:hypothetical protein
MNKLDRFSDRSAAMATKFLRRSGAVLGMAATTWLALALICYGLFYGTVFNAYSNVGREVLQAMCGRIVPNELIYTLQPGECRFRNVEFDTRVSVDVDGFRNVPAHLGTGPTQVALLGDSYAMGWGVDQDKKLSSLLAQDSRLTVRDLSMSSYGTPRELLALTRFAADADVVVLQYCSNDLSENAEFLKDPQAFRAGAAGRAREYAAVLAHYANRSAGARRLQSVVNAGLGALATTWSLLWLPPRSSSPTPDRMMEQEARLFAGVMAQFKPSLDGKTVIVFDAHARRVRENFAPSFRQSLQAVGLGHVIVLDLKETIGMRDYFLIDEHLIARGHARLAARILAELDQPGRLKTGAR